MFSNEEVIKEYNNYSAHSSELKEINLTKFVLLDNISTKFIQDKDKISIEYDSIINMSSDCIVNAANEGLLGGGGVDGVIHQVCGPELNEYIIKNIPANNYGVRISQGESVITPGFKSSFKWIIHTVAPYYDDNGNMKIETMKNTIDSIFNLVDKYELTEIVIPPIGTGFYGFHMFEFTLILFDKIEKYLEKNKNIKKIRIVTNLKLMYNYFKYYFDKKIY